MERVTDVLNCKYPQFNTIGPKRSIYDALHQMHCENVDHLIVLEDERFLGLLTEHGITEKIISKLASMDTVTVSEFMTTYLPVATLSDSLEYCMQLMERHNTRYIAIYDRFDFKGIITSHDLMKQALNKRNTTFNEVNEENSYPWNY
jgi:predicted transcriptional regulator